MLGSRLVFMLAAPIVSAAHPSRKLDLHIVPTPVKSYRLLAMDRDEDGYVWAGSARRHRSSSS